MADIKIRQNTTFRLVGELLDSDSKPVRDITAWNAKCHIRSDADKPLIVELTVSKQNNNFIFTLTPKQTSELPPGYYLYDILAKTPDGDIYVAQEGTAQVVPTITELPL